MSLSFFSQPFNKTPYSNRIHSPSSRPSRKRKRSGSDSDDVLDDQISELSGRSRSTRSPDGITASPPPSRTHQLEAQHPANVQPRNLGKNFPHRKPIWNAEDSISDVTSEAQDDLEDTQPRPIFQNRRYIGDVLVRDLQRSMGFRQQHIAALTTVLYKSILEGDYIRAGRAWGILLRTEVNGQSMDVRAHDRWGIGAEILCRRRSKPIESTLRKQKSRTIEDDSKEQALLNSNHWFSSEGFEKARVYYERLILQHPYRNGLPNAVSALDFYPAMFGLWIYSEQEKYELSLKSLSEAVTNLAQGLRTPKHVGKRNPSAPSHTQAHLHEQDIKMAFLQRGQQIAVRLDELLASPPFSDSSRLQDLKCMVNRWIEHF